MASQVDLLADIRHRLDICAVLEAHAVRHAALSSCADLRCAHALLAQLNHTANQDTWHAVHRQFHFEINSLGGNEVLATMVEELQAEAEHLWCATLRDPIFDLPRMHAQHRTLLSCIAAGLPEQSAQCVRGHIATMTNELDEALTRRPALRTLHPALLSRRS